MIIKNLCVITVALFICGCSTMQSIQANIQQQNIDLQEQENKIVEIMSDSKLNILRAKTALVDVNEITFSMLTNSEFVSEEDKVALILYADKQRQAEQIGYDLLQKWEGGGAVSLTKTANATYMLILAKLYNGEIRWAEFNAKTVELYGLLLTALEEIRANRIQAEIDESEMASQRAAQALYILGQGLKNYGNAVYGPAANQGLTDIITSNRGSRYQAPRTTNCTVYGNRMTCSDN